MIKIFPTSAVKELDRQTIESEPIASIDLMERAARALTEAIAERWDSSTPFTVFAGPGNNGGDALAVSRLLSERGYSLTVYLFNPQGKLSADCLENRDRLRRAGAATLIEVTAQFQPPVLTADHVVIDGLFGSGLSRPLEGGYASVVRYINASPATVVAIDVPSGLMGEDNGQNPSANIVKADHTLSLQFPKLAFLFAENEPYIGEWDILDIQLSSEAISTMPTDYFLLEPDDMRYRLRPRGRFSHKGNFGRALLIAGKEGMAGAAILAARACLRSGVGLLTVHTPFCNNAPLQTAVPEAMTEIDPHDTHFTTPADTDPYQAVAIGPGLGTAEATREALFEQIADCGVPMVLDADALNLLATQPEALRRLPEGSILTPHPKELERLVGRCTGSYDRLMKSRDLATSCNVTVVLKGAYTAIVLPDGRCHFNTTGNPGMATGGSGDVLTGILLALLAQGYTSEEAALLGVYAHGLSGDIARRRKGLIALTASDLPAALPMAWQMLGDK